MIVLVTYLIFILIFIIFSVAGIYHLWRFGYSGDLSKAIIVIYSFLSAGVIVTSLIMIIVNITLGSQ